ncbi:MAG: MFS transporter [Bacillota bacterium]
MQFPRPTGMVGFVLVWFGQAVSLVGTAMTSFALVYWAYQKTGQATSLALMGFFAFGPTVLLSPLAGALVDRFDRKRIMILTDAASALATLAILLLEWAGHLQIWHLYVTGAFAGAFQAFQFPAYSAAITTMIPKQHYGRANGMMQVAESGSGILAPILAGMLIAFVGIRGILVIDLISFGVAVTTLALVVIPPPRETEAGRSGRGSLWQESLYGFRYIFARPTLIGLQLAIFSASFTGNLVGSIMPAMVLGRTGNNAAALATVFSAGAAGGVVGGLLMSAWGGPKNRPAGVVWGLFLASLLGNVLYGLGGGLPFWVSAAFLQVLMISVLNGSNQAFWMAKVAPDVQGRVFATRRMIAQITAPVAMLIAGPLADRVFEPAMRPGGGLVGPFGGLVGTGPGAGIGLMYVLFGLVGCVSAAAFWAWRPVREGERVLADHDLGLGA